MKNILYTMALLLTLTGMSGCSANAGKFFDNDGPPSNNDTSFVNTLDDAVPQVESPVKAANRPYKVMGQFFTPMTGDKPFTQIGIASWYGKQFHGNKTAIGERYDMFAMSAAHPTMELPSYARVTNLANGRSVIVRVNDRGPFLGGRAIDMSYAAAIKLGYHKIGTAKVKIERITRKAIAAGYVKPMDTSSVQLATKSDEQALDPLASLTITQENSPSVVSQGIGDENVPDAISAIIAAEKEIEAEKEIMDRVEPVATEKKSRWGSQIGAFSLQSNAREFAAHAEMMLSTNHSHLPVRVVKDTKFYRVLIGSTDSRTKAKANNTIINTILGIQPFVVEK